MNIHARAFQTKVEQDFIFFWSVLANTLSPHCTHSEFCWGYVASGTVESSTMQKHMDSLQACHLPNSPRR